MTTLGRDSIDSKQITLTVFSWIFHAQRPLQMSELRQAISIQEGDTSLDENDLIPEADIIEVCGSFIIYDPTTKVVTFSHDRVREFLEERHSRDLLQEMEMAIACLTFLSFDVFGSGPCCDEASFADRLERCAFGQYAARYWGKFTKGPGEKDPRIRKLILGLAASSAKKDAMAQLRYATNSTEWDLEAKWRQMTLLHIFAENDLTMLAEEAITATLFAVRNYIGQY